MPFISVVIPTYNREQLLPRAIESVQAQTFRDFEVIVVDDGSTDRTAARVKGYDGLEFVRLKENRGVSHARNQGVLRSRGEWIAFLDSDDCWSPDKLSAQVRWIDRNPGSPIVQTNEIWIRNGARVNPPDTHRKKSGDIFKESIERCMITPSSVLITRQLLDQAGGFDESFTACEDYDLWLTITSSHSVGLVEEELLTRYGGHEDQLSSSVPCLDAYRIKSLMRLLSSGLIDDSKRNTVLDSVRRRSAIMAKGCLKRGKKELYEYYERLAHLT